MYSVIFQTMYSYFQKQHYFSKNQLFSKNAFFQRISCLSKKCFFFSTQCILFSKNNYISKNAFVFIQRIRIPKNQPLLIFFSPAYWLFFKNAFFSENQIYFKEYFFSKNQYVFKKCFFLHTIYSFFTCDFFSHGSTHEKKNISPVNLFSLLDSTHKQRNVFNQFDT